MSTIRSPGITFRIGRAYTRQAISAAVGGGRRSCLPTRDGRVVAACLVATSNPQAPHVMLCGRGPQNGPAGERLALQEEPVPVFVKEAVNRWVYRGRFRAVASYVDGPRFEAALGVSNRARASVSRAVFLEAA